MVRSGTATNGHIEQQYSYSDEAHAQEGTGNIHAPAICVSRTTAEGSGRPWPTANTTGEAVCDTEWCEPSGNWPDKAREQLTGRHDWSETDRARLFWVWQSWPHPN